MQSLCNSRKAQKVNDNRLGNMRKLASQLDFNEKGSDSVEALIQVISNEYGKSIQDTKKSLLKTKNAWT